MRLTLACSLMLLTACPQEAAKKAPPSKGEPKETEKQADAKPTDAKPTDAKQADAKQADPKAKPAVGAVATVRDDVPFPLKEMLGKTPQEVQPKLGEPTGKGMTRDSCVRFIPKRTWFECKYAMQRYLDPSSTYVAVSLTFEDGVSSGIAFEAIPGEGDFDPIKALDHLGVSLPGKPKIANPSDNVTRWSWFNSSARLVIDGKQYRVEVSTVDGKWEHSKVDFVLNHPLSDAQKAKIKTPAAKPSE